MSSGPDMRSLSDRYLVAPQLDPSDMAELAAAGIGTVICNRPDAEVPPSHQTDAMAEAARAAGVKFHALPLTHQTFTPENVGEQARIVEEADGPVLAYCASGTRSTIAWALAQAGRMEVDDIIATARRAGYDLENLRPRLSAQSGSA